MPDQHVPKATWFDLTPHERRQLSRVRASELKAAGRRKRSKNQDDRSRLLAKLGVEVIDGAYRMGGFQLPYDLGSIEGVRDLVRDMEVKPVDMSWLDGRIEELER